MGQVDVSELLVDPDFVDSIQVISRTYNVNSYGENVMTESVLNTVGSVQPVSGNALHRLPEELRTENLMSFWFKGEIVATKPGEYSSVLTFKGKRFLIKKVFDWTHFGQGWSEGVCVSEELS